MQLKQLAKEMKRSEGQCQYDENVKVLLSYKPVLAKILKYAVKEFMEYDVDTIIKCIEGEPEISKRGIYPGKAEPEKIISMNNESNIPDEGQITYDIRFYAIVPDGFQVKIILNIEAQKKYHVGYSFEARGVFYCARMLSEQLDVEFTTENYDDIKKVYSIWICMNAPGKYANTISEYSMQKKDIYGNFKGEENFDLLSVILIRLPQKENVEEQKNLLIRFLSVLLSNKMKALEKQRILEDEYGIKLTADAEGGVSSMCNLSDLIVEETTERVTIEVTEKISCQKLIEAVENVMESLSLSLVKACEVLKCTVDDYEYAKRFLASQK